MSSRFAGRSAVAVVALLAAAHLPLHAQDTDPTPPPHHDVAGAWELVLQTPRGERTLTVTLEQAGSTVSGLVETPMGERPLKEGVLEGDSIRFTLEMTPAGRGGGGSGRTMAQHFTGVVEDGRIVGEMEIEAGGGRRGGGGRGPAAGPRPFVMTRVQG